MHVAGVWKRARLLEEWETVNIGCCRPGSRLSKLVAAGVGVAVQILAKSQLQALTVQAWCMLSELGRLPHAQRHQLGSKAVRRCTLLTAGAQS